MRSTDPEIRRAAIALVGSHPQEAGGAVPALSALLDDASPQIRTLAAQTLGKLGKAAQPALTPLSSLLDAKEAEEREAAVTALGGLELDAPSVRAPLAKALGDDKPEVRRAAMRSIQRLGPEGTSSFRTSSCLPRRATMSVRWNECCARFERSGPDVRSVPELTKQLEHKKESVRLLAIKFLGLAGAHARDALPALERLRSDSKRRGTQASGGCVRADPEVSAGREHQGTRQG